MKKMLVSFLVIMTVTSPAWAAETMNMHNQINDAQASVYQTQSSASRNVVQGEGMKMMDMSDHEQAVMSHDMTQNGTSTAHQDMADTHKKIMNARTETTGESVKSFSKMSEHERVTMVYEKANNGQSSVIYQQQTDKHHSQSAQN